MDAEKLHETGLTARELAEVLSVVHPVSYVTVLKILKSGELGQRARARDDVYVPAAELLVSLVDSGTLPMKTSERAKRKNNVAKIKTYIQNRLA